MSDKQTRGGQPAIPQSGKAPRQWLVRAIRTGLLAVILVVAPSVSEAAHPYQGWLYIASAFLFAATGIAVFLVCISANKL